MERRALAIFILLLSSLVVLALIHYNQEAIPPVPSPTAVPATATPRLYTAMLGSAANSTQNVTITPSPELEKISYSQPSEQHLSSTPLPNQMTPTAMSPATPMAPMDPWTRASPMAPWPTMTPMPLSSG